MSGALEVLADPEVDPSTAWDALQLSCGLTAPAWEPETIRIELQRRGLSAPDCLMAKLLGAQTVVLTNAWTYDHDVLFSFALVCDGVPAAAAAIPHPTPEQLCWAMHELRRLTGQELTDEEGFDPDGIDPAVAVLLLDEGMAVAPKELRFCEDVLDRLGHAPKGLVTKVRAAWDELGALPGEALRRKLQGEPEDAARYQLARLAECRLYVEGRAERRARRDASLSA